jgi:lipopolysaccharide transport system permease protein
MKTLRPVVAAGPAARSEETPVRRSHGHGAFREVITLLVRHRELAWELAKRELTDRHAGSILGAFWAVGHVLFLIAVYLFVFAVVFQARLDGVGGAPTDYTAYLLAGLIPWMAFHEAMTKSCSSIIGNPSLVKQAVFPVEILPVKAVLAACLTQLIATGLLLVYLMVGHGRLAWTYGLLPLMFLLQATAMVGIGLILAAVSVYVRDTKELVQVLGLAAVYVMPVFYLPEWVPSLFLPVLYLNPFSYMTWCYQDVLYFGRIAHPWAWLTFLTFSLTALYTGAWLFRRLKGSFGGVL